MRATEIASLVGGVLEGPDRSVEGVASLAEATQGDLAYDTRGGAETRAGVLLARSAQKDRTVVVVDDPKLAFIKVLEAMVPQDSGPQNTPVHPSARIDPSAVIDVGAVVMRDCEIGPRTRVFPNATLYPGTRVGADCRIHAGAVLGADGFSYHATPTGPRKVPQVGVVEVGDRVEIGALCTVDRAFLGTTTIGDDCKLDDHVHIGHNCRLGRGVVIAAQSGLSGSVTVGDGVLIGGQVGITEHVTIAAGARVGAGSGVHSDLGPGTWLGRPAMPIGTARRVMATLRYLPEMWKKLR